MRDCLVAAVLTICILPAAPTHAQRVVDPCSVRNNTEAQLACQFAREDRLARALTQLSANDGSGAAEAAVLGQMEAEIRSEAEDQAEQDASESRFLKFGFGLGVGVVSDLTSGDRIANAELDANGLVRVQTEQNATARVFLETHYFFEVSQEYSIAGSSTKIEKDKGLPARIGWGPFVAIQSSSDEAIEAFGAGVMLGLRRQNSSDTSSNSFNLGLGFLLDPKVKVLGDDIKPNMPLPDGEETIRFKEESRFGVVLLSSFSF